MGSGITRDDWMAALQEAQASREQRDPSMLTLHEFADVVGVHCNTARRQLRDLVKRGLAERRVQSVMTADGRVRPVACYKLVKKLKGK